MEGPNPFLNHLVIENIIKFINCPDQLKTLRQVCSQWREIASVKLLEKSVVNISSSRKIHEYLNAFTRKDSSESENGTSSSSHYPFHKSFHIKLLQAMEDPKVDNFLRYILEDLGGDELHLTKCVVRPIDIWRTMRSGKELKTLTFNEVIIDADPEPEQDREAKNLDLIHPEMEFESRSLQRLEVTTCTEGEGFPWTEFFNKTPNLQVLHAQLHSSEEVTVLLESILELNGTLGIREFSSFLIDFDEKQINLLGLLQLPLKVLDLSVSGDVRKSVIEEFLGSLSLVGLENLKLFQETEKEAFFLRLPFLKNLKCLELMGDPIAARMLAEIGEKCPNLRSLNLSQLRGTREVRKMSFVHQKLSSLSVEEGFLRAETLGKIGRLFPNVREVSVFLNDDNISALFENFERLEELMVLGTELTDLGITGSIDQERRKISDCKYLRKFSLYPQPQKNITDLSVRHGLIHVSELASVELPETAVRTGATDEELFSLFRFPTLSRTQVHVKLIGDKRGAETVTEEETELE